MRSYRRILVTGGAGFVGASLALFLKSRIADAEVIAFDNLHRRGSELALARLTAGGVLFRHGDLRQADDLLAVGDVELILDCAAEPSVRSGYGEGLRYLYDTNLTGTLNTLELARRHAADVIFFSTSRIYPMQGLQGLPLAEGATRLDLPAGARGLGWSTAGIAEDFPLPGARSFYGATKLASELLIAEYAHAFGLRSLVNRCGVIAGPWQMGKVDQGFFVLWAARHCFEGPLGYQGYGGKGLQVRDVLAVDDLAALLWRQINHLDELSGRTFNVGGGRANGVSLQELTQLCEEKTGHRLKLSVQPETHPADVPWYIADNAAVTAATGWTPETTLPRLLDQVLAWLTQEAVRLRPLLGA
ncbi:MAG TPA: NAD-dependent epimerase/dehydratase family protein [Kiloniellales bacterium]|nr:NAD-dependent epimerase/dehydratase family protein [Kiloniellales bacterium]